MEYTTLSSLLVKQSWKTFPRAGFEIAGLTVVPSLCFASTPVQDKKKYSVIAKIKQRPDGEAGRLLRSLKLPKPFSPLIS